MNADKALELARLAYPNDENLRVTYMLGLNAGAEWQKEQDQPITGNSLEQEWLRYVDKKKKECRGELRDLLNSFANELLAEAVEGEIVGKSIGNEPILLLHTDGTPYEYQDKIRLIVLKAEEG